MDHVLARFIARARSLPGFIEGVATLALAAFFGWSALAHLENPYYFLGSVLRYELVSGPTAKLLAALLPFIQLGIAACLVARWCVGGSLIASSALLAGFSAAQFSVVARGMSITCGCFGASADVIVGRGSLLQVGLLLGVSCIALACHFRRRGSAAPMPHSPAANP